MKFDILDLAEISLQALIFILFKIKFTSRLFKSSSRVDLKLFFYILKCEGSMNKIWLNNLN